MHLLRKAPAEVEASDRPEAVLSRHISTKKSIVSSLLSPLSHLVVFRGFLDLCITYYHLNQLFGRTDRAKGMYYEGRDGAKEYEMSRRRNCVNLTLLN
jgi:hypothetical protein